MKENTRLRAAVVSIAVFASSVGYPCTFLQIGTPENQVQAQNIDWMPNSIVGIFVNKHGVGKSAGNFKGNTGTPAQWTAKFGSVTVGFGRELPIAGINEAGLSGNRLLFMAGQYQSANGMPTMEANQFLQYLLDTSASIDEAIARAQQVQVYGGVPTHYAVCDKTAKCAIFEFIDGKLSVYTGSDMPLNLLTNTRYAADLALVKNCHGGGCQNLTNSQWRFLTAAEQLAGPHADPVADAWAILNSVREFLPGAVDAISLDVHGSPSRWKKDLSVKNWTSFQVVEVLDLDRLDFSCKTPVRAALLDAMGAEKVVPFADYGKDMQTKLVNQMGPFFGYSAEQIQQSIDYPDDYTSCLE